MHVSANRSADMDDVTRSHVAHRISHPPITALPTRSPVFIVYLFPGASTVVRSPSAGSKMIGRRGWRLWAVDLVGLLVMAVMVEETLELKLATISMGIWERLYVPVSSNENLFIHVKKGNRILVPWGWLILLPLPSGDYIYYRVRFIFYIRKFRSSDGPLFANETAVGGPF